MSCKVSACELCRNRPILHLGLIHLAMDLLNQSLSVNTVLHNQQNPILADTVLFRPNIGHFGRISVVAEYQWWPNINGGRISMVAEYQWWPNINGGRISMVAEYQWWPNIGHFGMAEIPFRPKWEKSCCGRTLLSHSSPKADCSYEKPNRHWSARIVWSWDFHVKNQGKRCGHSPFPNLCDLMLILKEIL